MVLWEHFMNINSINLCCKNSVYYTPQAKRNETNINMGLNTFFDPLIVGSKGITLKLHVFGPRKGQ